MSETNGASLDDCVEFPLSASASGVAGGPGARQANAHVSSLQLARGFTAARLFWGSGHG
jgi:hypothetical protein